MIREDTLQSSEYVGIDGYRNDEDGNAPGMREAISQVKSIASDPAPITTNITIGVECEADGTLSTGQLGRSSARHISRIERNVGLPVIIPGTQAAKQIRISHFLLILAITSFLMTENRTIIEMMRMLKSMCWAFAWLNQPLTRHALLGSASGLGVLPCVIKIAPEMVFPRP
jgi:hypothetical protein